jgi:hypothetical protein
MLQLTADRKRFSVLCCLLAVGMLFWTRLIVIQDMPRVAMAEPMSADAEASENVSVAAVIPVRHLVLIPEGPIRNPFRVNPHHYPIKTVIEKTINEDSKSEGDRTDMVRSALEAHRLEAVMGTVAVVSGQTCRVGSSLSDMTGEGLRIELAEVRARSVVIRCGDVQRVLRLD